MNRSIEFCAKIFKTKGILIDTLGLWKCQLLLLTLGYILEMRVCVFECVWYFTDVV